MSMLLIFPPQWNPFQPYLSLPCLSAYLRKCGCEVEQRDLNIELFDFILSHSHLENIYPLIEDKYIKLQAKKSLRSLEQKSYFDLFWTLNTRPEETILNVDKAKSYMRSKHSFDDFERYMSNMRILKQALRMVSAAYSPVELRWGHYSTGTTSLKMENIMEASRDEQLNPFLGPLQNRIIPSLMDKGHLLVGLSITSVSQIIPGFTIARLLRKFLPDTHITVGGNVISRFADSYLDHPEVFDLFHSIVLFEGEESLRKLYDALHSNGTLEGIPNLIYMNREGTIIENERSQHYIDLNECPTPDFEGLNLSMYFTPEPILPVYATRGCYWGKCSFCDQHYGHRYRVRNISNILRDLSSMSNRYGARFFQFVDDALPLDIARQIADGLRSEHLNYVWSANYRVESGFTKSVANQLYQAGCKMASFGLESGSQKVLRSMKKGIQITTAKKVLHAVHQSGIMIRVSIIIGFPTETEDDYYRTLKFLIDVNDDVDFIASGEFILKRYSEVAEKHHDYGIRFEDERDGLDFIYHYHYSDYVMEKGMSPGMIRYFNKLTKETLKEQFPMYILQQLYPMEHLLILVDEFKSSDELRSSVEHYSRYRGKKFIDKLLARGQLSNLKMAEGIFIVTSSYDMEELIESEGRNSIHPKQSIYILNTNSGSLIPITESAMHILLHLEDCDNLSDLLETLDAQAGVYKDDCMKFLADAVSRDIVTC